jgi:acyl-[acyl-carrier-protein]-phospholipid O-acyltransferase/long-chain-fatty-acid--[acyl-carrier-protein] ligase
MPLLRTLARLFLRLAFRFQVHGQQHLNTPGPVILLPNHVSWIDWLFLYSVLDEDWRVVTSRSRAQSNWIFRFFMDNSRTFVLDPIAPYAVRDLVKFLNTGGRLVVFPEGHISRTTTLRKLFDGVGFLLSRTQAQSMTCYLRGASRLQWVRQKGWKQWFPQVELHIAPPQKTLAPLPELKMAENRSRVTTWIRDRMLDQQLAVELQYGPKTVLEMVTHTASHLKNKKVVEDVQGNSLTYKKMLLGINVLARAFESIIPANEQRVGLMLPNVAATPVAMMALWSIGRSPAMMNFSTGMGPMSICIQIAGLKRIITSRAFLQKASIDISLLKEAGTEIVFLEDVKAKIGLKTKLTSLFGLLLAPSIFDVTRRGKCNADDTAVILFTSGSEGAPKAVDIPQRSIVANLNQTILTQDFREEDRWFNALPMFHSFGLVLGTYLPLTMGSYVYLYPSPLHFRVIPAIVYDRDCSVLVGTNTFVNGYARRCHAYDFQTIRRVFVGGEKLQETTIELWSKKLGVRIFEGYGATEFSPLITGHNAVEPKVGSCGRFLPKTEWRLEPVPGVEEGGRLFIRGPQMMRGYLNVDANEKFKELAGWYDTGDIVFVDREGYVFIRGRAKRFAKVSGEMVSLTAVEEAVVNSFGHLVPKRDYAIITRPDENKGEALVLITTNPNIQISEVWDALKLKGLAPITHPREIRFVTSIPLLGTGKVDYRALAEVITT